MWYSVKLALTVFRLANMLASGFELQNEMQALLFFKLSSFYGLFKEYYIYINIHIPEL